MRKSSAEYKKHLFSMKNNLWMNGQKISRDDPRLEPGINLMSQTYDLLSHPKIGPLLRAKSHLTGKEINRFCHIHQTSEDLMTRHDLTKEFQLHTGTCIQRCGGCDTLNAFDIVSYNVDKLKGTDYHKRFLKYLQYFQENDFVAPITITDPKGDRTLRPHQQHDPDQYLHVVERKSDGIVVRGAKFHNSMAPYGEELLVAPTRALRPEDKDWCVCFAVPADWEGVKMVCTYVQHRPRKKMPAFYTQFGSAESSTIFDNVFVPWERVFMCGETEFGHEPGRLSSLYHRYNYSACKPAAIQILLGAAALAADYNGIERTQHVQAKLADMIATGQLIYATGSMAAINAKKAPSGTMVPDETLVHAARYLAGSKIYHEYETLSDIAGGLASTLPYEEDFFNPEVGPLLHKYIARKKGVPPEHIHKLWRYINELVAGANTGRAQGGGLHGGGSPIMEQIAMRFTYDLEKDKENVKRLCGITESK
jgi:4-hydroxyphenylacetate 3-monooxygenase/4-hydroxybutyryl-CoA dehydratase/vinylacetyl-CoA-Delta-isomerase